ncbi:MAG: hypothetical protein ACKVTZ_18350 [Bacteroidia bacterium]
MYRVLIQNLVLLTIISCTANNGKFTRSQIDTSHSKPKTFSQDSVRFFQDITFLSEQNKANYLEYYEHKKYGNLLAYSGYLTFYRSDSLDSYYLKLGGFEKIWAADKGLILSIDSSDKRIGIENIWETTSYLSEYWTLTGNFEKFMPNFVKIIHESDKYREYELPSKNGFSCILIDKKEKRLLSTHDWLNNGYECMRFDFRICLDKNTPLNAKYLKRCNDIKSELVLSTTYVRQVGKGYISSKRYKGYKIDFPNGR